MCNQRQVCAETGQEKWKFNAECPVNSPAISEGVFYFGCCEPLYAVMIKYDLLGMLVQAGDRFHIEGRSF